jgi:hypothetical protein
MNVICYLINDLSVIIGDSKTGRRVQWNCTRTEQIHIQVQFNQWTNDKNTLPVQSVQNSYVSVV